MQVKGLEVAIQEPRLKAGLGLGYMVNPQGADHNCNIDDTMYLNEAQMKPFRFLGMLEALPADDISPREVALFKVEQLRRVLNDCLVMC